MNKKHLNEIRGRDDRTLKPYKSSDITFCDEICF